MKDFSEFAKSYSGNYEPENTCQEIIGELIPTIGEENVEKITKLVVSTSLSILAKYHEWLKS